MKRTFFKSSALVLCLLMCLQIILGAGMFTLSTSAASIMDDVPADPDGTKWPWADNYKAGDMPHGSENYCYTAVYSSAYTKYLNNMPSSYTKLWERTVGNITTTAYSHNNGTEEDGVAYVVYNKKEYTLYFVQDDRSVTSPWVDSEDGSWTKVTEVVLGNMSQDRSRMPLADANGMSQIFTLEDGSYLILDGGYAHDSERLFNYLYDNNKRTDGKIVIRAWYLSHGHADHYECFNRFSLNHATDVVLNNVIAYSSASTSDWLYSSLLKVMGRFGSGVKLIRPRTGEIYKMPGLDMQIMYTGDDLYMAEVDNSSGNEISTVCKITVKPEGKESQGLLYTADLTGTGTSAFMNMYSATDFKDVDFFQVNHHGSSGGSEALFNAVKPQYLIWTSSQSGMELRSNGVAYQWIADSAVEPQYNLVQGLGKDTDTLAQKYERVFAADGAVELITFPYDGNRDALETYMVDDSVRQLDISEDYVFDASDYTPGTYKANELRIETGLYASGTVSNATFQITENGLRITTPMADDSSGMTWLTDENGKYTGNATTPEGKTPLLNNQSNELIVLFNEGMSHFVDGRTVIEYDMTYNESIVPSDFGVSLRVKNLTHAAKDWQLEMTAFTSGGIASRYRYNTSWQRLAGDVSAEKIPYTKLTTDYISDPNNEFLYDGFIVKDQFRNLKNSDGTWNVATADGVSTYTSDMTRTDTTIFGSTDRYKIVIDPEDGVDFYVNGVLVTSTRVDDAWTEDIYQNVIGTRFDLRVMPGMDILLDNIKVTREDKTPDLVITEIAPKGASTSEHLATDTPYGYVEVYNNADHDINIYDYNLLLDSNASKDGNFEAKNIFRILANETTWTAASNAANTVTHTNPADGTLKPGECALLWIPHNTMYNTSATKEGNGNTVENFRKKLGIPSTTKVFIAYNEYNTPMAVTGSNLYAIGHSALDYTNSKYSSDVLYGNFESFVYYTAGSITYVAEGNQKFTQTIPATINPTDSSSVRYVYKNNNEGRRGLLYRATIGVMNPGVVEEAQKRCAYVTVEINGEEKRVPTKLDMTPYMDSALTQVIRLTYADGRVIEVSDAAIVAEEGMKIDILELKDGKLYLYHEDFESYDAVTYEHTDTTVTQDDSGANVYTTNNDVDDVTMKELLGWKSITGTDGAVFAITEGKALRIYNPYYAVSQRADSPQYTTTPNYDIQMELGLFSAMPGYKVVLEYDFQYTDHAAAGAPGVGFTFGKFVDRDRYGITAVFAEDGAYRTQIGTREGNENLGTAGSATVTGENHVKIELDPTAGMTISVNDTVISTVDGNDAWKTLYDNNMGELLGLTVGAGMEVTLDNIELYEMDMFDGTDPATDFANVKLTTLPGVSIRTTTPTGMRWVTSVDATDYAMVKSWLAEGKIEKIEMGTLLIRTADLNAKGGQLTRALHNNVDCFAVFAKDTAWYEETPTVEAGYDASLVGTHLFAGSVASIKEANYNAKYSAVGFLTIILPDGTRQTIYGGYSEEQHARSVAEVAYRALEDGLSGLSDDEKAVIQAFAGKYEAS